MCFQYGGNKLIKICNSMTKPIINKCNKLLLNGLIYSIVIIISLWLVENLGVNVPVWDQWELVSLLEKAATSRASFGDFFAQHNEHRLVFPKLIFVSLAFITNWNIKYELYFSVLLTLVTFGAIYYTASISEKRVGDRSNFLNNIITCVLIFSLVQYENWLWGFQLAWFLINTCLVVAVLIIRLSTNHPPRLYFAAIPCVVASFSSAHGLLTWLAVIPSIIAIKGNSKYRKVRVISWLLLFAGTCAVYFIGYHKPASHPSLFSFLRKPFIAGKYFFTILGTPIVRQEFLSPTIGIIIFALFLFAVVRSLHQAQNKLSLNPQVAAWVSIGLFSLLFACMTTVGRSGFGVEQAMASRYTTSAILLIVATVQLYSLTSQRSSFIAGIMTGLFLINSGDAIASASSMQAQKYSSATCLELVSLIDKPDQSVNDCLLNLYPDANVVRERANTLARLGLRQSSSELEFVAKPTKTYGFIDSPATNQTFTIVRKATEVKLDGWAVLRDSREQPKLVLLSYGNQKSFFTTTMVNLPSPDVAQELKSSRYEQVRWTVNISPKFLPLGETKIKAWVYDPANKRLIKLNGEPKIKVVE